MLNVAPYQRLSDFGGFTTALVSGALADSPVGLGIASFGIGLSVGNMINHAPAIWADNEPVQDWLSDKIWKNMAWYRNRSSRQCK